MAMQYERWPDLLGQMRRGQGELYRLLGMGLAAGSDFPPVNVWAGSEGMIVTALLPGIDPESIDVTVHQDTLTLRGTRRETPLDGEQGKDASIMHRRERIHGEFVRDLALPLRVDADKVSARYELGVLRLDLPRPAEDKPRRVKLTQS